LISIFRGVCAFLIIINRTSDCVGKCVGFRVIGIERQKLRSLGWGPHLYGVFRIAKLDIGQVFIRSGFDPVKAFIAFDSDWGSLRIKLTDAIFSTDKWNLSITFHTNLGNQFRIALSIFKPEQIFVIIGAVSNPLIGFPGFG